MAKEDKDNNPAQAIINHLQQADQTLSTDAKKLIEKYIKESYDNGYEDGLTDGKDISDHPISG